MKNTIFLFSIILLILSWCSKVEKELVIDTWTWVNIEPVGITNNWTWVVETSTWIIDTWTWYTTSDLSLSIYDKLALLNKKEDVLKKLKNDNFWDYSEELPRIESYYTKDPFYEFYILKSIQEKSSEKCNLITSKKEKKLCLDLFTHKDKDDFLSIYKSFWEEKAYSQNMYNLYLWIEKKSCEWFNDIIIYLMCKKILNKDENVRDIFIKYYILISSNLNDVKANYIDISDYWQLDKWFKDIVKNTLKMLLKIL